MQPRRIERLKALIQQRVAEVVRDLSDPRLGFLTITKVSLDREMTICKVYWSVLGKGADVKRNAGLLRDATGHIRTEVAKVLTTRTTPEFRFIHDESIAGAVRVNQIIAELSTEDQVDGDTPPSDSDSDDTPQADPS